MKMRLLVPIALAATLVLAPVLGTARPDLTGGATVAGVAGTEFAPVAPRGHLDSTLDELVSAYEQGGTRELRTAAVAGGVKLDGESVRVALYAQPDSTSALVSAVAAAGGRVDGTLDDLVMADIPVGRLAAFSEEPSIRSIFAPPKPEPLEVTSQGIAALNMSALASATPDHAGYTGAGVKVGILDEGFTDYATLLGSELPPTAKVHVWSGNTPANTYDSKHGTAVCEIIHDIAPDAELYLAAVDDPTDVAQALVWMRANGVTVVNMSMGWWAWARVDGTGPVDAPFDIAIAQGMTCIFSGGNYRQQHWAGDFVSGNEPFPYGYLHNWQGAEQENQFTVDKAPRMVDAWLWWDDWATASQDYNLQLVRWNGSSWDEIRQSRDNQSVTKRPVEHVSVEVTQTGTYGWRIWRASASRTDVDFDFLVIRGQRLVNATGHSFHTTRRSMVQPADNLSPGGITVAATAFGPTYKQEDYSSEGPTIDGRNGIDISSVTVVDTASYGSKVFNGTSAAAPHIAGLVALIRQAEPYLSPAEIEQRLYSQSRDLGAKGIDPIFGVGRVWLKRLPALKATRTPTIVSYGKGTTIKGVLKSNGKTVAGQTNVTVWRKYLGSSTWKKVTTAAWNASARNYQATVRPTANASLQMRFGGSGTLAPRRSDEVTVGVRANLTAPTIPSGAKATVPFVTKGTMKPNHVGPVKIALYRHVSGKPVFIQFVTATVTKGSASAANYRATVTLPLRGTWTLKAWHQDDEHAESYSAGRSVTVQ